MKAWLWVGAAVAVLAAAGLLATRLAIIPVPAAPPSSAAQAQAAWGRVLARFVNAQGEVDFEALSRDRADLDRSLRYVADTPLDSLTDVNERLAHMINAYNALSMFNVIDRGIPQSHAGANKLINFLFRRLHIGGRVMSLYRFENELIRPLARRMGDPRVHFALNCSARSCPALPQATFTAARLDSQLERETRAFFARPQNFRIDAATRTVWLSEILSYYTEDFVPAQGRSLIEFANRYAPLAAPLDAEVHFTSYDWTIANSRRSPG